MTYEWFFHVLSIGTTFYLHLLTQFVFSNANERSKTTMRCFVIVELNKPIWLSYSWFSMCTHVLCSIKNILNWIELNWMNISYLRANWFVKIPYWLSQRRCSERPTCNTVIFPKYSQKITQNRSMCQTLDPYNQFQVSMKPIHTCTTSTHTHIYIYIYICVYVNSIVMPSYGWLSWYFLIYSGDSWATVGILLGQSYRTIFPSTSAVALHNIGFI